MARRVTRGRGSGRRRPGNRRSGGGRYWIRRIEVGPGVRKILARNTPAAGITASISPHTLRHFLFTWLKTQGIDDALIQPYSGHATRQFLEIYSRLALADAQQRYDDVIGNFPV